MNKLLKLSSLAALVALSGNYALAETATGNASVTVSNAFTLSEDTALTFGTIRAVVSSADGTAQNVVTMTLPANGTNPSVTETVAGNGNTRSASMNIITPGTPGTFSVSGAAPNSILNITFDAAFPLTIAAGGPTFLATINQAYITSGPNANRAYSAGVDDLFTDATGAVTFDVGGTLATQAGGNATDYRDQTYTGTYTMTVDY